MNGATLFSCAGIGEYYLKKNDIHIKVANELLEDRAKLYKLNYPNCEMVIGDICKEDIKQKILDECIKNKVELLIATPPCQGFSTAGNQNENDSRNFLTKEVVDIIHRYNEFKYIVIENVPGYLTDEIQIGNQKQTVISYLISEFKSKYFIEYKILNASDYGCAQSRKRAIILMSHRPFAELSFPTCCNPITLKDVIGHLPSLESGEKSNIPFHNALTHNDRHILWMQNTPTGKSAFENPKHFPKKENGERIKAFPNTYKRMSWDKPAPTVTMNSGCLSSQNTVHPGRLKKDGTYSDARVLTVKELMLITGLDDKWKWGDTKESIIRDVLGECVPPQLLFKITKSIKSPPSRIKTFFH